MEKQHLMHLTLFRKMKCIYIILLSWLMSTLLIGEIAAEATPVKRKMFMTSPRQVGSFEGKALSLVYTEAFKKLGLECVYTYYPAKRASMMAENGLVDGEFARLFNYNAKIPNLIRVEEPIYTIRFSAFTTNPEIKLNGWESLKDTGYKVEYMRGFKGCEAKLSEVVSKDRLSGLSHWSQGLKKIVAKRTDIYVEVELTVLRALKTDEFKDANIRTAGVMEEVKLYPFLHKKNSALVPKLAVVIKEMKKDGAIEKLLKLAENSMNKP